MACSSQILLDHLPAIPGPFADHCLVVDDLDQDALAMLEPSEELSLERCLSVGIHQHPCRDPGVSSCISNSRVLLLRLAPHVFSISLFLLLLLRLVSPSPYGFPSSMLPS
eukprot:762961-Hanusia_phi.AAC.12